MIPPRRQFGLRNGLWQPTQPALMTPGYPCCCGSSITAEVCPDCGCPGVGDENGGTSQYLVVLEDAGSATGEHLLDYNICNDQSPLSWACVWGDWQEAGGVSFMGVLALGLQSVQVDVWWTDGASCYTIFQAVPPEGEHNCLFESRDVPYLMDWGSCEEMEDLSEATCTVYSVPSA